MCGRNFLKDDDDYDDKKNILNYFSYISIFPRIYKLKNPIRD